MVFGVRWSSLSFARKFAGIFARTRTRGCRRQAFPRRLHALSCCLALACLSACGVDPAPLRVASPDLNRFANEAYPVLLRDCGFPACHGASARFFRVYGPGRSRFMPAMNADPGDPATIDEINQSYDRTRSMIDARNPVRSLLLRKPLASAAGGAGHKGEDLLGRNVYATTNEPGYQALRAWVLGLPAPQGTAP
jgi:hypothetical protein